MFSETLSPPKDRNAKRVDIVASFNRRVDQFRDDMRNEVTGINPERARDINDAIIAWDFQQVSMSKLSERPSTYRVWVSENDIDKFLKELQQTP